MTASKLTGKTRYRRSLLGKMILQVEVGYVRVSDTPPRPGLSKEDWQKFLRSKATTWSRWRDADEFDVQELRP